ncbi:hypothetical protein C2G38_2118911 [Gigaspora rosea]|uniref:Uncharacterized protein n=1 Tax=Gigaspora rosea TaxID=44941 RepID=A0A397U828_9GLOM|nr:hypothetical protein C2G38_2123833 [Gigaspora rosea]RIB05227.1 hypothetical protein C2G38_2118911 [Gigaspora rosea]
MLLIHYHLSLFVFILFTFLSIKLGESFFFMSSYDFKHCYTTVIFCSRYFFLCLFLHLYHFLYLVYRKLHCYTCLICSCFIA